MALKMRSASCFNPTLVRLRHEAVDELNPNDDSFNPTLVRLRPPPGGRLRAAGPVSIPRWFD